MKSVDLLSLSLDISPRIYGMTFPKNLEFLPSWLTPTMGWSGVGRNCPAIVGLTIRQPLTYALAESLWTMQRDSSVSIRNSDRSQEDRQGLPMCSTLEPLFSAAKSAVVQVLAAGSKDVTSGRFILSISCLEESPSGKRFLHDLRNNGDKNTYAPIPGATEMRYKSASEIAEWIRPRAELWATNPDNVRQAMSAPHMAASYITGS